MQQTANPWPLRLYYLLHCHLSCPWWEARYTPWLTHPTYNGSSSPRRPKGSDSRWSRPRFQFIKEPYFSRASQCHCWVGRAKNPNKNPVAERAIQDLEEELLQHKPGGCSVSVVGLVLVTARLNLHLRHLGLSSCELWTQRSQFTNKQLPISDYQVIAEKHQQRTSNHTSSENHCCLLPQAPELQVGDLVYLIPDKNKSQSCDLYIIVKVDGRWCFVKKFRGSQLRAFSYKVKLSDCYAVPPTNVITSRPTVPPPQDDDDVPDHTNVDRSPDPVPLHPLPPAPPEITNPLTPLPVIPKCLLVFLLRAPLVFSRTSRTVPAQPRMIEIWHFPHQLTLRVVRRGIANLHSTYVIMFVIS